MSVNVCQHGLCGNCNARGRDQLCQNTNRCYASQTAEVESGLGVSYHFRHNLSRLLAIWRQKKNAKVAKSCHIEKQVCNSEAFKLEPSATIRHLGVQELHQV